VRDCDLHGNVLAYSGSMGNAVRITHNNIYANTAGISTDTISAGGHPGFPADSVQIDRNWIYSNNLELFKANPPITPRVGVLPVGVGIFWPGHNNGRVFLNTIWDNWRNAAFLLGIPDSLVTPEGNVDPGVSCPTPGLSTSCGNRFYWNQLGRVPTNFRPFPALYAFGNNVGSTRGVAPNGLDFWWDEGGVGRVTGNCWYANKGPDGTAASVTGPGVGDGINDVLPSDCGTSSATGDAVKVSYLLSCFLAREGDVPPEQCDWYTLPPQPGTTAAAAKQKAFADGAREFLKTAQARQLENSGTVAADPVLHALDPGVKPLGEMLAGSVAPMATCGDWMAGDRARRLATIHDIRQQINLVDSPIRTLALSDDAAYGVFERTCKQSFASGFRLYKLYARADAFAAFAN
jgi:hypothetical protein